MKPIKFMTSLWRAKSSINNILFVSNSITVIYKIGYFAMVKSPIGKILPSRDRFFLLL
jgi:hypothetical protein